MSEPHIQLEHLPFGEVAFSPDTRGMGRFQCGDFVITMLPARLGIATEAGALLRRCRRHEILNQAAWTINTESRIPRETEPWIIRAWTLAGNHLRVISDLRVGGRMAFDFIENDSMSIVCDWKKIEILPLQNDPENPVGEWLVIRKKKDTAGILFENALPPLVMIITSVSGERFEITEGEDLWRPFASEGAFRIETTDEGLQTSRRLGQWTEPREFAQQTWRRKWHLAHGEIKGRKKKATVTLDVNELEMPEIAQKTISGGRCMMSDPMMKGLRRQIRHYASTLKDTRIAVQGWQPGFCTTASHCGRPNTKPMIHWDLTEMLEFWQWANRQLARSGCSLAVEVDKTSPFAVLPSVQALAYPESLIPQD